MIIIFANEQMIIKMSPRNKLLRKVINPPSVKGFKPYGPEVVADEEKNPVVLLFEEYETLRWCDYDGYTHEKASKMMGVSRPTFSRIYAEVRRKIAKAFVEGRKISIEGGKVYFDSEWYHCNACDCYFNHPERDHPLTKCALCGSSDFVNFDLDPFTGMGSIRRKNC